MSREKIDKLGKSLLKYPNVIGFAKTLQKRERDGEVVEEWVLQVHVSKKVPENELRKQDILPKRLGGVSVDVKDFGEIVALQKKRRRTKSKTDEIRPLEAGISIGNAAITAGTLGWFMEKTTSPNKGEIFIGSNSHVLCDEPKNPTSLENRIVQPGDYDGGTDIVGYYYWHKQLYPVGQNSTCNISKSVTTTLNYIASAFGRKTRFVPIVQKTNHIDFAVATILDAIEFKFFDVVLPPDKFRFVGFGFAGSDVVSLICKQQYVLAEGYTPYGYEVDTISVGDMLHKTGRTSCYNKNNAILESAYEVVNFGSYMVAFDDVAVANKMLDPGDSGSAIWKEL